MESWDKSGAMHKRYVHHNWVHNFAMDREFLVDLYERGWLLCDKKLPDIHFVKDCIGQALDYKKYLIF